MIHKGHYDALVHQAMYESRYGNDHARRVELKMPNTYHEMVDRATKPGLQHEIVTHSYAVVLCERMGKARNGKNNKYNDRLKSFREPSSSAMLTAMPGYSLQTD